MWEYHMTSDRSERTASALLGRHPVAAFLGLTFAISWGGILAISLPTGIPGSGDGLGSLVGPVFFAMLAGPFLSAIIMSFVLGWPGWAYGALERIYSLACQAYRILCRRSFDPGMRPDSALASVARVACLHARFPWPARRGFHDRAKPRGGAYGRDHRGNRMDRFRYSSPSDWPRRNGCCRRSRAHSRILASIVECLV